MLKCKTKDENLLQTVRCGGFLLGRAPFSQCALSIARQAASCNLDSHVSYQCCGAGNISFGSGSTEAQTEFRLRSFIRLSPLRGSLFQYLIIYIINNVI
jgi:hypothetical protein